MVHGPFQISVWRSTVITKIEERISQTKIKEHTVRLPEFTAAEGGGNI